jgi:NAD(P)H-nitrite reductase large subunit
LDQLRGENLIKDDILEKGAICQRNQKGYGVAPHIPGGFIGVEDFRKLVNTADKYQAKALKMTSGQRIAVIGLSEDDLDTFWQDVQMDIGYAIGLCVRMVKFCPGTTYCRHGKQDAMGVGGELDRRYHGRFLSAKFKIGVAGCEYACNAPRFKEVWLLGLPDGWQISIGGTCGAKPRFGDIIAERLNDSQAFAAVDAIVKWFESGNFKPKVRMGRIIDELGLDAVKKAIGI